MKGVINIYKPKGCTSHDVVNMVRKALGGVKAGHTGTLDPAAEGVLPICVGKATKIADYIASGVKGYRAELILGANTDTQDATGTITKTFEVNFDEEKITTAIMSFEGHYLQTPPMYSAIKINGRRLYSIARQGQEIERPKRSVEIYSIKIIELKPPNIVIFETICSKGTYIRSLCEDIGTTLLQGGHMGALLRFKSGMFCLDEAVKMDDFLALAKAGEAMSVVLPIEKALSAYKCIHIDGKADKFLHNGNKISHEHIYKTNDAQIGETVLAKDSTGNLAGLYLFEKDCLRPVVMLL